jgi:hypothetical protein
MTDLQGKLSSVSQSCAIRAAGYVRSGVAGMSHLLYQRGDVWCRSPATLLTVTSEQPPSNRYFLYRPRLAPRRMEGFSGSLFCRGLSPACCCRLRRSRQPRPPVSFHSAQAFARASIPSPAASFPVLIRTPRQRPEFPPCRACFVSPLPPTARGARFPITSEILSLQPVAELIPQGD